MAHIVWTLEAHPAWTDGVGIDISTAQKADLPAGYLDGTQYIVATITNTDLTVCKVAILSPYGVSEDTSALGYWILGSQSPDPGYWDLGGYSSVGTYDELLFLDYQTIGVTHVWLNDGTGIHRNSIRIGSIFEFDTVRATGIFWRELVNTART